MTTDFAKEIELIFQHWYEKKDDLASYFRNGEQKAAEKEMKSYIESFLKLLFYINHQRFPGMDKGISHIGSISMKPLNFQERFLFLLERPAHYHSFIQLSELYDELLKLYKKNTAIQKQDPQRY